LTVEKCRGAPVQRTNPQWSPPNLLPPSYFAAVDSLAAKHGWRIEQESGKYYLRSIDPPVLRPVVSIPGPCNHLAFFYSLGEIHDFLMISDRTGKRPSFCLAAMCAMAAFVKSSRQCLC